MTFTLFFSTIWSSSSEIVFRNFCSNNILSFNFWFSSSSVVNLLNKSFTSRSWRLISCFTNSICWEISAFLNKAVFFSDVTLKQNNLLVKNLGILMIYLEWYENYKCQQLLGVETLVSIKKTVKTTSRKTFLVLANTAILIWVGFGHSKSTIILTRIICFRTTMRWVMSALIKIKLQMKYFFVYNA